MSSNLELHATIAKIKQAGFNYIVWCFRGKEDQGWTEEFYLLENESTPLKAKESSFDPTTKQFNLHKLQLQQAIGLTRSEVDSLERYLLTYLSSVYKTWCQVEGGFGTILIDIENYSVEIDYNEYYLEFWSEEDSSSLDKFLST